MTGRMGRRAFVGLLVAGLLMQTALAKTSYNSNENDQNENQNNKIRPQPFRQGNEYVFQYDAQVSTGLVLPSSASSDVETTYNGGQSGQKSVTRLQAQATINFITENRATLELSQLRTGRLNDAISADPKRIQPMRIFEATEEMAERFGKLSLPIDFVYVDGIVERINFHPEDSVWSKNMKRAVLNQIQVNLKRKTNAQWSSKQQQQQFAQQASQESQEEQSSFGQGQLPKSFVVPETSVEGICQMTYTINDNTNSKYEKNTELQQADEEESTNGQFNVTKSINFKNCRKIADIAFGYQPEESVKAAKCARAMQNANANGRFAPIDDESCDPKELDNTKLDRSTVQRIELVGNAKRFGIKRSETVSHYVLKNFNAQTSDESAPSAMHTISVVQLVFRGVKSSQNPSKTSHFQLRDSESKNGGESTVDSLLYDNEWERTVKEFYMLGDEQFNAQNSPFKHVQKKAEQAQQIVRLLMQAWNDKQNVMEGETVAQLHRLVHILRMSTVEELKEIQSAVKSVQQATGQNSRADAQKTEQLFADALAIAGTRNTVYLLVQKIHNGELPAEQAAHSLKKLQNVPAPSDAITTMIGQLAKNEIAHRSPALQQSAWLTFGAMINQMFRHKISTKVQQKEQQPERSSFQQQQQQLQGPNGNDEKTNGGQQEMLFGTQNGFPNKEIAGSLMKKESYKQMLIKNYQQAQTTYDKVLALKAIGNAGLDNTVNELEKIANGKTNESPMIRAVAIDALRRLRSRMPRKIQRIVLPIFQNTNERSEVRMTAFAALMNSQPEAPILDQVLYTLSKERSRQVQSYAYSTAKALSESEVPESQNIAKHLKSALQLTGVSEEEMSRDSLKVELPFQWSESGAILKLVTMYTEKQSLPAQLAFGLDSIFNGQRNIDSARLSLAQQGTQGWLENAVEALLNGNNEDSNDKTTRDRRQQATNSRRADEELRSLIPGLQIKSRQQSQQPQSKYAPFAMASLRFGDVDQAMFALDQHSLPQPLRQLLEKGESAPIAAIVRQLAGQLENQHVRWINAVQLNEKTAHVPTSAGMPLKIGQSTPVLVSVDANAKVQTSGQALDSSSVKAFVNAHIAVTAVHLQKMEIWTPVQSWGVMSKRSVELQAPIQAEIYTENNEENNEKNPSGVKIALKVPQTPKMRLFGAHSFAATYIIDQINMHRHIDAHTSNAIKMRAIRNPALQQTLSESIEMNEQCYGENAIGIPICVSGHFRMPNQPTSAAQWLQIVMATENDIHVSLQPKGNGPRAIVFGASGELFKRAAAGQVKEGLNQLEKFYENAEDNFHPAYPEEYRDMKMNTYEERRYKLEQILKKLTQEKQFFYKHSLKLSVCTEGGDKKNVNAQLKVQAIADSRLQTVCVIADAQRSPLFAHENQPWTLKAKAQFLTPETVSSPAELERLQSSKQQTFLGKIDAEWGTDRKENVNIRVQGNNAQRKNVNGEEQRELTNQWSSDEIQQQTHKQQRAASFINHFEVAVAYKLSPQSQNAAKRFFDNNSQNINIRNLWNSDSQQMRSGRDGQIYASLTINPQTAKQANVQLRTPTEIIKVNGLELPTSVRFMPLIKHGEKSTHSVAQFLSRVTRDATRDECKVDGRRVMSFDGPVFKGPITTKCYQVLALDCVNAEQPKFAVLMRSLDASGQQKKIKVMTPEQVVECQAKPSGNGDKKIECKINGQTVTERQAFPRAAGSSEEQRFGHPIVEYNNDEQTAATITAPNGAVSVRFAFQGPNGDSQKATIRLANKHKYGQCGLCGHYDDTLANEWRMNNGESTNDLAAFQRSYTVLGKNVEGEVCTKESAQAQYEKTKNAFSAEMFNDNQNDWAMLSNKENKKNNRDSQDSEWRRKNFGGYLSEDSQEDRDFLSYGRKSDSQKKIEPVMKTKVIERNHEVCLSAKPLKQCPEGTVPASNDKNKSSSDNGSWGAWDSEDEGEKSKVEFVCMDRSDAYPYLRDISNKGVASNLQSVFGGRKFQMDVRQPSKCKRY